MSMAKTIAIAFVLLIAVIILRSHAAFLESAAISPSAASGQTVARLQTDGENSIARAASRVVSQEAESYPPVVRMQTAKILNDYYVETLSVVPATIFSPVALQLGFAQTVNRPVDEHGNTLLHIASKSGDLFSAWQLLEFGANPHIANKFKKQPLDVIYSVNSQVEQALTAGFSSNSGSTMADVIFGRIVPAHSVKTSASSSGRTAGHAIPVGVTIGVISR